MADRPCIGPNLTRRAMFAAVTLALQTGAHAATTMLRIGGSGAGLGGLQMLGDALSIAGAGPGVQTVRNLGSDGGIRALSIGATDFAISNRPLHAAERDIGLRAQLYAVTPLVFATHLGTQADDITLDRAVAMIGGGVTAWLDGMPVRVSRRPVLDTDTSILAALSPEMAAAVSKLHRRPGLITAASDHDQARALEVAKGSFGIIALALVRTEQRPLTVLRLDGRSPDTKDWPMRKPLHIVYRDPLTSAAQVFLEHLFSDRAVALLGPRGHIMSLVG